MEVRLKVLVGPNAGRELPVAGPKFSWVVPKTVSYVLVVT